MYHCYFLINYIGLPKVFFLSFGPLFKKFAHHWFKQCKKRNPKIVAYINSYDFVIQNWLEIHFTNPNQSEKKPHLISHCLNIPATTNMKTKDGCHLELNILTKCRTRFYFILNLNNLTHANGISMKLHHLM